MSLSNALQVAIHMDDLDEACRTLQDALGVTDGALAGLCFSDLSDDSSGDLESWSTLSISERRTRLVSYLKSEIDLMQSDEEKEVISLPGFSQWHTGGGCMALAKHLLDGSYWLVTSSEGTSIPRKGDDIGVGHYSAESGDILFECYYDSVEFDREAFLARVAASERHPVVYDRCGMEDENERRDFIEEQEHDQERMFEEFKATRRQMSSREYGKLIGDAMWDDHPEEQFLVYDESWWIGICDDGRHHLVIGNQTWITGAEIALNDLELKLFEFSVLNS